MIQKILLPLDGSELAETAIPYVGDLAGQLQAEVYLIYACAPDQQTNLSMHQTYLSKTAENLKQKIKENWKPRQETKIKNEVIIGDPIKVIADYVKQNAISMVALTSHGSSGFKARVMGSVADRVVREVGIPTLLIRIKETNTIPPKKGLIQKILLPLDASGASKIAVPYAVELAGKLKASIALFSMAPSIYSQAMVSAEMGIGFNGESIDASTEKYTDEYLKGIETEIRKAGVEVTHTSFISIDAAREILEMERKIQPDLVIMATRGRSNIARWVLGSVAERVLTEGDRPILMIKETAG